MRNYSDDFQEIAPHKKKSTKRPPKKSNHKHEVFPCFFTFYGETYSKEYGFCKEEKIAAGEYCPICGKIMKIPFGEKKLEKIDLNQSTVPIFWVSDFWKQKYVDLEHEEEKT